MKVINTTESDRRLPDGTRVDRGKSAEVDDVLGADLLDQGWGKAPAKKAPAKKAPAKNSAPADEPPPDGGEPEGA